MKKKHKEKLIDLIGDAVVEFNAETDCDDFEITIRVKCEDGFVSHEFYEIKKL